MWIVFFRKDGKSFATISIRRRKEKKQCQPNFLNGNCAQKTYNWGECSTHPYTTLVQQPNNYHNSRYYLLQLGWNDPTKTTKTRRPIGQHQTTQLGAPPWIDERSNCGTWIPSHASKEETTLKRRQGSPPWNVFTCNIQYGRRDRKGPLWKVLNS